MATTGLRSWRHGVTLRLVAENQSDNNSGGVHDRVTISQAAKLLGCHPNTVRSRVKAGLYSAEKVLTENGPTWMIDRASLTTNAPTSATQQPVSEVPALQQVDIQELARQIVKDAGLQKDPVREAVEKERDRFVEGGIENYKALATYSHNMATLSGATLVAVTVVTKTLLPNAKPAWMLVAALGLLFFAMMLSSINLYVATAYLRRISFGDIPADADELDRLRNIVFTQPSWFTRWEWRRFQFITDYLNFLPNLAYYAGLALFVYLFLRSSNVPLF
jgi:hypothetical protein